MPKAQRRAVVESREDVDQEFVDWHSIEKQKQQGTWGTIKRVLTCGWLSA